MKGIRVCAFATIACDVPTPFAAYFASPSWSHTCSDEGGSDIQSALAAEVFATLRVPLATLRTDCPWRRVGQAARCPWRDAAEASDGQQCFRVVECGPDRPPNDWLADFLEASERLRVPVLLKGAAHRGLPNLKDLSYESLVELSMDREPLRDHKLFDIPYGDAFTDQKCEKMTVKDYVQHLQNEPATRRYLFSEINSKQLRLLERLFDIPDVFISADPPQFAIGGVNTGAPVHWHKPAFNFLLSGAKEWFFMPPERAVWSNHPIVDYVKDEEGRPLCEQGLRMQQAVGDVVFVPHNWGHGVLNKRSHTVCVAQELSHLARGHCDGFRVIY